MSIQEKLSKISDSLQKLVENKKLEKRGVGNRGSEYEYKYYMYDDVIKLVRKFLEIEELRRTISIVPEHTKSDFKNDDLLITIEIVFFDIESNNMQKYFWSGRGKDVATAVSKAEKDFYRVLFMLGGDSDESEGSIDDNTVEMVQNWINELKNNKKPLFTEIARRVKSFDETIDINQVTTKNKNVIMSEIFNVINK
jgi:hypothetical protein